MQTQRPGGLGNQNQLAASNKANFNQSQKINQLLPASLDKKRVKTATKRGITNYEANPANFAGFETKYRANGFIEGANNDDEAATQIMQRYRGIDGGLYT